MQGSSVTPVSKAIDLLIDMQTKIKADGVNATKIQAKKAEACKLEAKDLGFSIETKKSEIEAAKAQIAKASAKLTALSEDIQEMLATVANNEASLANATKIRENETATFKEAETELTELIDTLQRATTILAREMPEDGALLQGSPTTSVVQALESLVQGSTLSTSDASRLRALIQSNKVDVEADDGEIGAPDAAVYESHSDNIIMVLEKLLDQAQAQLADARKAEMTSQHNFAMTEQSLQMETKDTKARLVDAKKELAATTDVKETSTDALDVASKGLADDEATLSALNADCEEGQKNFEAASESRDEELAAIDKALDALNSVGAAEDRQYGASFLQQSELTSDRAISQVSRLLRDLARKGGTPELAQLASRVSFVMQEDPEAGDDPFAKVKGLISTLLKKLQEEAKEEASEKEKCDRDLADYRARKEEQTSTIEGLTSLIDSKSAMSSKLKEEVEALTESLAELVKAQAEMDAVRKDENAEYKQAVIDMQQGLQGVGLALKALSEYYAKEGKRHQASGDSASGIIGMLEVVKSDFTLDLAKLEETESQAQSDYESLSQANAIEKTSKEKDVKYKTQESAALDKAVADATTDRAEVQEGLAATNEYLEAREKQCAGKVETYEERKKAREAEIAGLKEALTILSSEVALVQLRARRAKHSFRLEPSVQ